jgi:hypothetical protein
VLLRGLKDEITVNASHVFVHYPAQYAGLSTSSSSGAQRGVTGVVLDGLSQLGERIRCDLLENLSALHLVEILKSQLPRKLAVSTDDSADG